MSAVRFFLARLRAHRTAFLFLGALVFGAMAVVGMRNYIGDRLAVERERLQPRHDMVELVVAKRDLSKGETVGPDTMAVREVPREFAPGGAIDPDRFDALIGARLAVPMRGGEPLLAGLLSGAEAAGFSSRLKPGIRAMTVAVDEVNSLSGMLQPGDRIDLMLSVRPQPSAGAALPEITRTLMQDVLVLATGRQIRPVSDTPAARAFTAITVEVDPDQAQKLVVAQRNGRLTATLRNPDDRQAVTVRKLDVNMLLGIPAPIEAPPPPLARPLLEVIVGGRGALPMAPSPVADASTDGSPMPTSMPIPIPMPMPTSAPTARTMPMPMQMATPTPSSTPTPTPSPTTDTAPPLPGWPRSAGASGAVPVLQPALIR
jgi:pilus assembly protein CpaB